MTTCLLHSNKLSDKYIQRHEDSPHMHDTHTVLPSPVSLPTLGNRTGIKHLTDNNEINLNAILSYSS